MTTKKYKIGQKVKFIETLHTRDSQDHMINETCVISKVVGNFYRIKNTKYNFSALVYPEELEETQ